MITRVWLYDYFNTCSEGHLRQMRLFAENPHSIIDSFSKEFEQGYLQTLSHRHGTKRVKANVVYQEYIADKNHVHMNATCWTTLTGFCMHLGRLRLAEFIQVNLSIKVDAFVGREGKAVVDETEKGWFIQYIDRDPKMLARKQQAEQRQKYEMDEEERHKREIEAQIKAAEALLEKANEESEQVDNSLLRSEDQEKIAVSLHLDNGGSVLKKRALQGVFSADEDEDVDVLPEEKKRMVSSGIGGARHFLPAGPSFSTSSSTSKNMRVLDHLMLEEQKRKKSKEGASKGEKADESDSKKKKDFWLWKGIFVKVVNEQLFGGKLHKQKGRVLQVLDRYSAEVEIDGKTYKIDQGDLETVIPAVSA